MKPFLCVLTLVFSLTFAQAQNFLATLDGLQDGGGLRQGSGSVTLNLTGTTLTLNGSFSGLSSGSSLAHIHGPGAVGVSASPVYNLITLGLVPLGVTSGTISGTITLATAGTYTLAQQMADLNNGLWYVNIHDANFPGGEIRGQILLPVPEPATWALGGLGLLGILAWKRRT